MADPEAMPIGSSTGPRSFTAPARRPRSRRRRLLIALGGLLAFLTLLLLLAPTLAGWYGRGYAEDSINKTIPGKVHIAALRLSWMGPQRAEGIVLLDPDGKQVATIDVKTSAGLWGLAMGRYDLGTVTVGGAVDVAARDDGKTNLERALGVGRAARRKPAPSAATSGAAAGPPRLPASLAATIVLERFEASYADPRLPLNGDTPGGAAVLHVSSGKVDFAVGKPVLALLAFDAFSGANRRDAKTPAGSANTSWTLTGLIDAQGLLTPADATIDGSAEFKGLSVPLADSLAAQAGRLTALLGPAIDLSVDIKGSGSDLLADFRASSPTLTADIGLHGAPDAMEISRTATIKTGTKGFAALAPGIIGQTPDASGAMLAVDQWPDAELSIQSLRLPLASWSPDWSGLSARIKLEAGEATGRVAVGGGDEGEARVITAKLKPLAMTLETASLADGVHLTASNSVELDGHKAGHLAIDLTAAHLTRLGPAGGPALFDPAGAMVDGVVTLAGFSTQAAQPFVQAMGLRLAQDVGPEVDLEVTAAARAGDGTFPETSVELRVNAKNLTAGAQAIVEHGVARTVEDGVKVEVKSAGPAVSRLAKISGLRIQTGMPARLTATDLHLDLARAFGRPAIKKGPAHAAPATIAQGPDLRGSGGTVTLWIGETTASAPLTAGAPARALHLPETTFTLETSNLAQGAILRTHLEADVDGKPAGTFDVTAAALSLLDESGAWRGISTGPFRGRLAGKGVPTDLIQSFLPAASSRLDLPTDIGPAADFTVTFAPHQDRPTATDCTLTVRSEKLTVAGDLLVEDGTLNAGSEAPTVTLRSPGPLLARFLPEGFSASQGGTASIAFQEFAVPLGLPLDLLGATGRALIRLDGLALTPPNGPPLQVASTQLSVGADAKGAAVLGVDSTWRTQGQAFSIKGDMRLDGLIASGSPGGHRINLVTASPTGSLALTDAPFSLLNFVTAAAPAGAGNQPAPGDLSTLLHEAIGKTVSASLVATPAGGGTDLRFKAEAQNASLNVAANIVPGQVRIADSTGEVLLTPRGLAALLARYGPATEPRPTLRGPARIAITAKGATIPRDASGMPDLAGASPLAWTASVPGRVELEHLPQGAVAAGDPGSIGVDKLSLAGSIPLGAFSPKGAGDAKATVTGGLIGGQGAKTGKLDGTFAAHIESRHPQGPLTANLKVIGLDTRWADTIAAKPGLAAGLLGESADLDVGFHAQLAPTSEADATGQTQLHDGTLTASLASPSFSMSAPATVLILPDRFELKAPTIVKATIAPQWANQFLLSESETTMEGPPPPRAASFAKPADVTLNFPAMVISRGAGPMKPGVFSARAIAEVPRISMLVDDETAAEFSNFHVDISAGDKPGVIGFSLKTTDVSGGAGDPDPIRLSGGLYGTADDAGRPTFDDARITATGHASSISSAVIDALAGQDGLLVELLGPTVSMDVELAGFGRDSGKISAKAASPRATGSIKGTIQDHVLVTSEPVRVELKEITPALGERLVKGLPLVGAFEKRPEDGPAILTASSLEVPLNHDLTRLNADAVIDFGRARFETGRAFSAVLKVVRAKDSGEVGRRLDPLTLTVRKGVFSYNRYTLPLGEFSVDTQGSVDMANRTLDLLTYIPIGALTDEAAGMFNTGLGRLLGGAVPFIEKATMVPWRTRGPMSSPTTTPDLRMFVENTGRTLLSPGTNLIKRIDDLFTGDKDKDKK